MNKVLISNFLRKLHVLYFADRIRYYWLRFKNKKDNEAFKKNNPLVKLPPDYLIYESFQINYSDYYFGGLETAKWLVQHFEKYIPLDNAKILDWGCGPGRLIRHLPAITATKCKLYGTDYNAGSIDWCSKNLPGIQFNNNTLQSKLPWADNFFDVIYGISIFTHLSEQLHHDWSNELTRVLRPGGILFITAQGDNFRSKLTDAELAKYDEGLLLVRGNVKEGHRTYSAFHPKKFMRHLFEKQVILEHIETPAENTEDIPQDVWIIQKK
jgi:ubiquinone/menaquinone biosynthesis C-methylase UbiE